VKKLLTLIIAKRKYIFGNFELAVSEPAGFHVPREAVPVHPADDKRAEEVDDEDGSDSDDQVDDCQLSWVNNYSLFLFFKSNFHQIFNKNSLMRKHCRSTLEHLLSYLRLPASIVGIYNRVKSIQHGSSGSLNPGQHVIF
jgi:hypothetical protein